MLKARDEAAKERCMEAYREIKRCIYQSKKEVNEQFGRKMNQETVLEGSKVESCSRVKDGNGRLAL